MAEQETVADSEFFRIESTEPSVRLTEIRRFYEAKSGLNDDGNPILTKADALQVLDLLSEWASSVWGDEASQRAAVWGKDDLEGSFTILPGQSRKDKIPGYAYYADVFQSTRNQLRTDVTNEPADVLGPPITSRIWTLAMGLTTELNKLVDRDAASKSEALDIGPLEIPSAGVDIARKKKQPPKSGLGFGIVIGGLATVGLIYVVKKITPN